MDDQRTAFETRFNRRPPQGVPNNDVQKDKGNQMNLVRTERNHINLF